MNAAQVTRRLRPFLWALAAVALVAIAAWRAGIWNLSSGGIERYPSAIAPSLD